MKTTQLTETTDLVIDNRPNLQAHIVDYSTDPPTVGVWQAIDPNPVERVEVNQDKGVTISYNGKTVAVEISGLDLSFH